MAQIRIKATWNAVTYNIFYGYTTDWGQVVLADDNMWWSTIEAKDGFVLLERLELPSSAWALEVQKDSPTLWFRLGETNTVRATDSSDGGNYGLYDNCIQGAEGLIVNDADGAVQFVQGGENRVLIQNPTLISAYPFTVSAVVQRDADGTGAKSIFEGYTQNSVTGAYMQLYLRAAGTIGVLISDGTNSLALQSEHVYEDGIPHHIVFVFASSSDWRVYVDGVAETMTTAASVGSGTPSWGLGTVLQGYTIGNHPNFQTGSDSGFGGDADHPGTIDEVVVWNGTALGTTRITAHALAAKTGWDNDDTGARVTRFLDAINWPASLRDISTGISLLGPASWSKGTAALSVLQDWADTEYGLCFMSGDGKVVWKSRHARYLATASKTSQATFGDVTSGEALVYLADGFELARDEARIRNPVTASRVGGVAVTIKDQTLIDNKYWYGNWDSPPTQDRLDSSVRDRAIWLLARFKEQTTRLGAMKIRPRRNPSGLWPQVLGREIGDQITVKRTPLATGNQISTAQWIESIRHDFVSGRDWVTTWAGSPFESSAYLVLDDATLGKLDTGVLAY